MPSGIYKRTKKHKQNISKSLKKAYAEGRHGFVMTEERRRNMSESHIGNKGYWRGRKRPELTGENHYNWKGGNPGLERTRFRDTLQKKVFERDNYTCQMCNKKGGQLQVDHIQPWADFIEGRFDMDNCRTLCMDCHYFVTYKRPKPKHIKTWGHKYKERSVS